jgi:hypothetical protein
MFSGIMLEWVVETPIEEIRNMAGPKYLSAATVKAIFKSKEPASTLAERHEVSVNLVYLIWDRKIHKAITQSIRKPIRKRKRRGSSPPTQKPVFRVDVNRIADRVADLVLKRLLDRLRGRH